MDSTARRVQAERNRRRLPPRRRSFRWARRISGLIGTAVLVAVAVAIASMVAPGGGGDDERAFAVAATPTPTKTAKPKKQKAKAKAKGPTKAQREALAAAVAEVRRQGYTTLDRDDYDPKATLRVLIGRPVGDAAGGSRAFFFNEGTFVGNDASSPSAKLSVSKTGKVTVTLSYGVFEAGDAAGAPSGRKRVRFRLDGGVVRPLDTVPLDAARFQRRR